MKVPLCLIWLCSLQIRVVVLENVTFGTNLLLKPHGYSLESSNDSFNATELPVQNRGQAAFRSHDDDDEHLIDVEGTLILYKKSL